MAKKEKDTISLKEAILVHLRAMKDIHKVCPKLFPATFLSAVVTAVTPYVTVALSARIITELSTLRRSEVLWRWVVITVTVTGLLSLLNTCLSRWWNTQFNFFRDHKEKLFVDKAFSMDYADREKQSIRDLRSQITQNENYGALGLPYIPIYVLNIIESLSGILSAVVLTWSLFTLPVPESGGSLTLLNSPLFILVLFGVMLG
ncbi:MAG: ABC transporter ATP-binding protein, partial [Oscillospiraceae bacterium]|nr:ABC transporter ATP-binding protein [Oscillospiraceae bacterium]